MSSRRREFGAVRIGFWSSPTIRQLDDRAKLLALYVVAGPHTNALGCFRCPPGYVAADLGWSPSTVAQGFDALERAGLALLDADSGWVFIPKFLKHNQPENPNQGTNVVTLFGLVPESMKFRTHVAAAVLEFCQGIDEQVRDGLATVARPLGKLEQKLEQKLEREGGAERGGDAPTPPASPEVIRIPLRGGHEHVVTEDDVAAWSQAYPGIHVVNELRGLREWCLSHPTRLKAKGRAFCTRNLARAQQRQQQRRGGGRDRTAGYHPGSSRFAGGERRP